MDRLTFAGAFFTLYLYFVWRTVVVARQFRWWVMPTVFLIDHVLLLMAPLNMVFPFGALLWNLSFLYAAERWGPARGLFTKPQWPRVRHWRGPRRTMKRRFDEPPPWDRGPCSF